MQLSEASESLPAEEKTRLTDPVTDDPVADAQWLLERWGAGAFEDITDRYVALYRLAVVGTSNDPVELAARCAATRGVSRDRIVIKYVGRED